MLSNQPFQPHQGHVSSWIQLLQGKIQQWIRQEIIAEDPCDEEKFTAQKVYEQFQALEKASKAQLCAVRSHSSSY
jgi:hypothetical protein